ncbi:MAG: hypothetical protein ACP5L2_07835 [Conexivisphaera sp.]
MKGMLDESKSFVTALALLITAFVLELVNHMIVSYMVVSVYGNLNTANLPPKAVTTITNIYRGVVIAFDLSIVILIITAAVIIMGLMGSFGRAPDGGPIVI